MKKAFLLFFFTSVCFFQAVNVSAQGADLYKEVPESQRKSLRIRLNKFINIYTKKQWNKVFEMIAPHIKNTTEEELKVGVLIIRNADFFKDKWHNSTKKFTPKQIVKLGDDFYKIVGCGTFVGFGQRQSAMDAFYENGTWYFSESV